MQAVDNVDVEVEEELPPDSIQGSLMSRLAVETSTPKALASASVSAAFATPVIHPKSDDSRHARTWAPDANRRRTERRTTR
jgi:hypothetical protein